MELPNAGVLEAPKAGVERPPKGEGPVLAPKAGVDEKPKLGVLLGAPNAGVEDAPNSPGVEAAPNVVEPNAGVDVAPNAGVELCAPKREQNMFASACILVMDFARDTCSIGTIQHPLLRLPSSTRDCSIVPFLSSSSCCSVCRPLDHAF